MFSLKNRLLLLCLLFQIIRNACWQELPLLRTGTISPISTLVSPSTNYTVVGTYTSPMASGPYQSGIAIHGYKNFLTKYFSFNVTAVNIAGTGITLYINTQDSTYFSSLRLSYIVTGLTPTVVPKIEILRGCFKCLSISQAPNVTTSQTARTQTFGLNNSITFTANTKIRSFLYAFNISNVVGSVNYIELQTQKLGNYQHTIITREYNMVSFFCATVIAWEESANVFGGGIAAFFQSYLIANLSSPSAVPIESRLSFSCKNLYFMGFSSLGHQMSGQRVAGIYPQDYSKLTTLFDENGQFMEANVNIFYIGFLNCSNTSKPLYWNATMTCELSCAPSIQANVSNNCLPCDLSCIECFEFNQTNCTICNGNYRNGSGCDCMIGYYANATGGRDCLKCSDYIPYCATCLGPTACTTCFSTHYLVGVKCECLSGIATTYFISGVCLKYPGCITAQSVTNGNYCSSCNTTAKFQHPSASNLTCVCMAGYSNVDNPNVCKSICGNGIVLQQACDDNNTASNDGCSSNCTVENGYFCFVTPGTTGPSKCINISEASITYLYAERVPGTNQGILHFIVFPLGLNISSTGFEGAVTTDAPAKDFKAEFNPSNSRLKVTLTFTEDMEANFYTFTFDFNNTYSFFSQPISLYVQTNGINQVLKLQTFAVLVKTLQYLIIGLSFVALGLGIVSSIVGHKLIGLQLLLPLQISYFALIAMQQSIPYVDSLKNLKFTNGFNQIFSIIYDDYYQGDTKLMKIDYYVEFVLNVNVMAAIVLVSSIVLLVLQLNYMMKYNAASQWQSKHAIKPQEETKKKGAKAKKQSSDSSQIKQQGKTGLQMKDARQKRNNFINHFFFFSAASLIQQVFMAFVVMNMQYPVQKLVLGEELNIIIAYFCLMVSIGIIMFAVMQLLEKREKRILTFKETRAIRYPVFLIIAFAASTTVISLVQAYSFSTYAAAVLSFVPLIGFIVIRPYRNDEGMLNTIGAVVDLSCPCVASILYLVNSKMDMPEMIWLVSAIIVFVFMMIMEVLTIVRLVKNVAWKQLYLINAIINRGKVPERELLEGKSKPEIEMSQVVKENMVGEDGKMLNWEERNRKEYQSLKSKQNDDEAENSEENDEDELAHLKRRLRKEIHVKRAF